MAEQDALTLIFSRNIFYRRLYHLALAAFTLSLFMIVCLSGLLYYIVTNPARPLYFATDNMGVLIKTMPLNQPNMSVDDVGQYVINSVGAAYSYDYVNYRAELQDAQKYFTTFGWRSYMKALEASNNLVALTERKMIIRARVIEKPKLYREGITSGRYAYKFSMPVLVTYLLPPYDGTAKFSNALEVDVLLVRQPDLQSYKGLGVVQMVGSSAKGA